MDVFFISLKRAKTKLAYYEKRVFNKFVWIEFALRAVLAQIYIPKENEISQILLILWSVCIKKAILRKYLKLYLLSQCCALDVVWNS